MRSTTSVYRVGFAGADGQTFAKCECNFYTYPWLVRFFRASGMEVAVYGAKQSREASKIGLMP